ncbi:hypothetical protein Efla_004203 [Eimeria flavescens]
MTCMSLLNSIGSLHDLQKRLLQVKLNGLATLNPVVRRPAEVKNAVNPWTNRQRLHTHLPRVLALQPLGEDLRATGGRRIGERDYAGNPCPAGWINAMLSGACKAPAEIEKECNLRWPCLGMYTSGFCWFLADVKGSLIHRPGSTRLQQVSKGLEAHRGKAWLVFGLSIEKDNVFLMALDLGWCEPGLAYTEESVADVTPLEEATAARLLEGTAGESALFSLLLNPAV